MKHIIFISTLGLFFFLTNLPSNAQPPAGKEHQMDEETKAKMKALHKAFITDKLLLTEEESSTFWPIYDDYMRQQKALHKKLKQGRKPSKDMSEEEANQFITKRFEVEQQRLDIKRQTFKKLSTVIPAKKIIKLQRAEKRFKMEVIKRMKKQRKQNLDND